MDPLELRLIAPTSTGAEFERPPRPPDSKQS